MVKIIFILKCSGGKKKTKANGLSPVIMHLTRTSQWPVRWTPRDVSPSSPHSLIHSFILSFIHPAFIFFSSYYMPGLDWWKGIRHNSYSEDLNWSISGVRLEHKMNRRYMEEEITSWIFFRYSREDTPSCALRIYVLSFNEMWTWFLSKN